MAAEIASERVCYVHCNFCNTVLAVSVPSCSTNLTIVTVRCGHCSNLLSVNLGALLQPHFQDIQKQQMMMVNNSNVMCEDLNKSENSNGSSSSKANDSFGPFTPRHEQPKTPPIRPPEKRQRVPSAYNRFIKEEIQRIKASNPTISHREAFSTAAKNWAHFPHIHFGWKPESNKQASKRNNNNVEMNGGDQVTHCQKSLGLY